MRDRHRRGIAHRTSRIILITLSAFLVAIAPTFPQNFSGIFFAPQVLAQTPNQPNSNKNPASADTGSFIDYFAEERQFKGHEGSVNSASFSPDDKLIVTAGADNTARVWDFSGKQLAELIGHQGNVKSANFSPDSKLIVTASFDGTVRIWDISGKQLVELKGHQGNVYSANFSPDGKAIATAGADKTVRLWDLSGKQLREFPAHESSVYSANFSSDGKKIVTASADKTARVWDLSGKQLAELKGHQDTIWNANFSPDGKQIVTASDDKTARVWDLSGKQLAELKGHQDSVLSARFSRDGKQIVTASVDLTALVWKSSGKLVGKLQLHQGSVNDATFSPADNNYILTASSDATSRMWDISSKLMTELRGHKGGVESASFSPNGKLIVTASWDRTARIWDLNGKQIALLEHKSRIISASFSPDGQRIVTECFSSEYNTYVWETSGKLLTILQGQSASFSPDGKLIATAYGKNMARVWNLLGKVVTDLTGHQNSVDSVSFSSDGKLIVTASNDNTARIWDISGKQLAILKGHRNNINNAKFSPDGNLIVTASNDNTARVWNTSGKQLAILEGHNNNVKNASFSLDGKQILTTSVDGTARVWDILGQQLIKLEHQSPVTSANFSPNGKLIVTASEDKTIQVWNTSGKQLYQIGLPKTSYFNPPKSQTRLPNSEGIKISFSPDGQQFVTTGYDDIARVWFLSDKLLAQLAQLRLPIPHFLTGGAINVQIRYSKQVKTTNFSPDGRWLVTAEKDGFASLWDINGRLLVELIGHSDWINSASFSPDGKLIVTASWDKTTRVWNLNGKQIALLQHQDQVNNANFSPDGKLIITQSNDNTSRVWDLNGKQIALLQHQERVNNANFSPDNKLIVTASDDDIVHLWDLSGKQIVLFKGKTASFSPNGKLIVTTSDDDTIRVWNNSGQLLKQIKALKGNIYYANFSPNGKFIITASNNDIASVLDASGKLLLKLQGSIKGANFSPDSKLIVTQSSEQTMKLWNISGELLAELKHQSFVTGAIFSPDSKRIVTASDDDIARVWNTKGKLLATLKVSTNTFISLKVKADRLRDLKFSAPKCAQAFEPWQKALKIYQEISDNENKSVILEQLGNAYYCLNDYTKAIESYKNALEIAKKSNYLQRQVKNLANLGNVYNSLADNETAIKYYNDALKILEQNQDAQLKTNVLQNRSNIYISQGKYNEAIEDLSQALVAIDINAFSIAKTKINLANIYYLLGDYNKAIQYYREVAELIPSEALGGLGNVYLVLGDTAKAMELHQQSLAKAQQNEDKEAEGNALNNLANALRQAGKLPEAEKYLRDAIAIWENLRIKLDDANKISIFEKQTRTYRLLQEVLIAQNKITEALEISERGRARAFIDLLNKRVSPNQTEQSKVSAVNIEQIKQIAKNEIATLVQYSIITDEFKVDGKQQTQESELYIWVIKPTGEVSFRSSDLKPLWQKENTTLAKLVTTSRQSIGVRGRGAVYVSAKPDATKAKQRLQRSHELLIKPIADILPSNPNDRVIFIPQGELFLVPFPALQYDQDKYLIEKHTILTAPSIQVLDFTSKQKRRAETLNAKSLIVGNPAMPKVELEPGKPPEQLKDLPWAEKEAKDIASILKTQALTGKEASKTAILQKISQAGIIHFATHGLLDDNRGLGSAIALAPSSQDNGLLTAEEILNLKLNADLVVLSACDTGRGRITGDGVIGLSRSLISAGVPSVIVSLWAVDDNSTSFLMTEFYTNLQQKLDKATALRKAMLTTMQKYPEPLNWAAFTLIGES